MKISRMSLWSLHSTRYFEYPHHRKREVVALPRWLWLISGKVALAPNASWTSSWGSAEQKFSGRGFWYAVHKISRTFSRNCKQNWIKILWFVLIPLGNLCLWFNVDSHMIYFKCWVCPESNQDGNLSVSHTVWRMGRVQQESLAR